MRSRVRVIAGSSANFDDTYSVRHRDQISVGKAQKPFFHSRSSSIHENDENQKAEPNPPLSYTD